MTKVAVPQNMGRNESVVDVLVAQGVEIVRVPALEPGAKAEWTAEEIEKYFADADGFVGIFGRRITREVLEAGKKLRAGVSPIIGTETIDVDAATDLGIVVGFGATPENLLGVAEAVVMLTAAQLKNLPDKWNAVRSGGWRVPDAGRMVMGSTVGLIGLGNIGQATARRLQGWECRIVGADPFVSKETAAAAGIELVSLDELLRQSDVVSIAVTLIDSTYHMIGEREFALMKPTAYLINTSRGPCVDEEALIKALSEGRIAGAAVDTWEQEPTRADNPLRTHPKVIGTGHNVGHSQEAYDSLTVAAGENISRALRGEPPLHTRNPEVLPRWRERMQRLGVTPIGIEAR
jgi:D-3-phosphoglycerate dehydrogenase / 2-oxoglutarate reductase